MFDLDAYFARIGYVGSRAPTLSTLHALTAAHTQAIPFENLDVLLGRGIWTDVYEFTHDDMPPIDREVANWFTSAHPGSHFKNRLIVARAAPDGRRLTLVNGELKIRGRDGRAEVHPVASAEALLALLQAEFGLRFPPETRFGPAGSPWPV